MMSAPRTLVLEAASEVESGLRFSASGSGFFRREGYLWRRGLLGRGCRPRLLFRPLSPRLVGEPPRCPLLVCLWPLVVICLIKFYVDLGD
jgi:hypothetical protein